MKSKIEKKKFNFLTLENASQIKGSKPDKLEFCVSVEIKQCVSVEGTYCGTGSAVEVIGPHNPWG
ncbi:MAG: hypothetical protein LBP85_09900 [Prevotellaceae bacterium]|jgi:hypothetical protein|nr:hypothetical protein [Prevotellaceae bacterium]